MPATVLIVEDDEPTQKLLQTLMNRGGVAALIAPNGAAAIEIFDSRPDLACMILDLMMPTVDGLTVLDHVSASGRRVPVIICTAAVSQTMPSFDPAVVRAVVRKPFDIDQLMETVTELIG